MLTVDFSQENDKGGLLLFLHEDLETKVSGNNWLPHVEDLQLKWASNTLTPFNTKSEGKISQENFNQQVPGSRLPWQGFDGKRALNQEPPAFQPSHLLTEMKVMHQKVTLRVQNRAENGLMGERNASDNSSFFLSELHSST